ncbi:pterin cluster protein [Natronorubrum sp. FCH18a]|uniref:pterin cluster protein n=1 Tax=Natronorubrum sp. FCH18a TaxID=3447018 RepID=UPI003F513994
MSAEVDSSRADSATTVTVRCTGHVRDAVGSRELEFAVASDRLRTFLAAFAATYDLEAFFDVDLERESDPMARLWARPAGEFPGWRPPDDDRCRPYGRICLNGQFSVHFDGLESRLEDGDRIALLYPFLFAP